MRPPSSSLYVRTYSLRIPFNSGLRRLRTKAAKLTSRSVGMSAARLRRNVNVSLSLSLKKMETAVANLMGFHGSFSLKDFFTVLKIKCFRSSALFNVFRVTTLDQESKKMVTSASIVTQSHLTTQHSRRTKNRREEENPC